MKTVLAGDLGGTKCRFALVADDGSIHGVQHRPTIRERGPFLEALDAAFAAARDSLPPGWQPPTAVGIGTPGVVLPGDRVVDYAPNVPLSGFDLAAHLEERLDLPACVLNDGRASALGEATGGVLAGKDPLLAIFFGTGIGIGLVIDGRPYGGGHNAAGEIGHTLWKPGGRQCPCGRLGCYEAYCGGRAIVEQVGAIGPAPEGGERWDVGRALEAAEDDAGIAAIFDDAAAAATALVANACTLLNPQGVVLGGGVLQGWPGLVDRVRDHVAAWCSTPVTADLQIEPSTAGSDAILWGAAAGGRRVRR